MPKKIIKSTRQPADIVNIVARLHVEMVLAQAKDVRKITTMLLATATLEECREVIEHLEKLHEAMIVSIPEGEGAFTIVF